MQQAEHGRPELTPEESWRTIHTTMAQAQSSMYLSGAASILLLWGAITSLYFFTDFAVRELAPHFVASYPWYDGRLWGVLATAGMVGSAVIGHHAGRRNAAGDAARSAGIRVFLFWMAVVVAALLIPAAAGMWTGGDPGYDVPRIAVGIVSLGYVLFGIMYRPALAVVGAAIAAAFYIPGYFAIYMGDLAAPATGAAMLAVAVVGALWIRKSGLP